MFTSVTFFRILISFLRPYIHISPSFFYIFVSTIFKKSVFIRIHVSFEYLRHLVIVNFCSICLYVRYLYKITKKKQVWAAVTYSFKHLIHPFYFNNLIHPSLLAYCTDLVENILYAFPSLLYLLTFSICLLSLYNR